MASERPQREQRFERRMSDAEALMWNVEKDPWLNPSGGTLVLLDRPPDIEHFRSQITAAVANVPRLRERVVPGFGRFSPPTWKTDAEFNLDRTFSIELRSTDVGGMGWLRYYAGIMSTQGRDMPFAPDLHLGYYARLDVNPFGFFNDYVQGDLARNVDPRLSIGVGYAYLDHAPFDRGSIGVQPLDSLNVAGAPNGTTDMHLATADVVFMWRGFSFTGEWSMRQASRHQGTALDPMTMMPYAAAALGRTGFGMHALAGIMLGDLPLEIALRAGMLRHMNNLETGAHSAILDQNEAGAGINWYIQGHPLKLSLWFTDVWRDDGTGSSGAQVVRLQLQATL